MLDYISGSPTSVLFFFFLTFWLCYQRVMCLPSYCKQKWDLAAPIFKTPIKRPGGGKERLFYFGYWQPAWGKEGRDYCPKANFTDNQWARTSTGWGRTYMQKQHSHLGMGHWWSDQHHLDFFKYSQSSIPGYVCFHFLRNCGSFCHGHSLVTM